MSLTLRLARAWYGVVGLGTLLMTAGHVTEGIAGGARFDAPIVAVGLAVGLSAVAAAAWVVAQDRMRAVAAWIGIAAVAAGFLYALWLAVTTAGTDAVVFIAVPTVIALAAAARMALARARAREDRLTS